MQEKKLEDNINLTNIILEVLVKTYPIIFGFLILLDITLFINTFEFELGTIQNIFLNLNLINLNLTFLIILIPFILASYVIMGILSVHIIPNKIKSIPYIQNNFFNKKRLRRNILIILFTFIINILSLSLMFLSKDEPFVFYLVVLFSIFILSISIKTFKIENYDSALSTILTLLIIGFIYSFFSEDKNLLFINTLISLFVIGITFMDFKNSGEENKYKLNKLNIFIIIFITFTIIFIFLNHINSSTWKSPMTDKTIGINYLSFNLLFNKGLVVKNKSKINIDIKNSYFKLDTINKITSCKNNLVINSEYWYLNLTNNLKLYAKELEKEIVFLLVEEKVNSNAESIYSLIDLSIIKKNET